MNPTAPASACATLQQGTCTIARGTSLHPLAISTAELLIALLAAITIAMLAYRKALLSLSGAVGAVATGTALVATGGWWLGALLIIFFITSSLLPSTSTSPARRDWRQVAANGGPALAFSIIAIVFSSSPLYIGSAATIAAAASDTWATELGKRFGGMPVSIVSGRRVAPGTSGAVSRAGLLASIGGAVCIGTVAILLKPIGPTLDVAAQAAWLAIVISGAAGSTLDTFLGGIAQARFRCIVCGTASESSTPHQAGHDMALVSGVRWMTNGTVNLIATTSAGILAATLAHLLP